MTAVRVAGLAWAILLASPFALPAQPLPQSIYVSDIGNDRIVRITDMDGSGWVVLGRAAGTTDQFADPRGLAVDARGRIYVADTANDRIVRIDDMSGAGWIILGQRGAARGRGASGNPRGLRWMLQETTASYGWTI